MKRSIFHRGQTPTETPPVPDAPEKHRLRVMDLLLLAGCLFSLCVMLGCFLWLHGWMGPALPKAPTSAALAATSPSPSVSAAPSPSIRPRPSEIPAITATPPPVDVAADVPEQPQAPPQHSEPAVPVIWAGGYYLRINVLANTVTVYTSDAADQYTVPVRAMVCSTGAATPGSGIYGLGWRQKWQTLFGEVYGQYVTQITGNILFHSVPYTTMGDKGSLEYWEFDKLGTSCSAGCIRLQVQDAKWIYDNRDSIAAVEFYSSTDPGPLGKPGAPKISGNKRCRGWDPSDPDPDNPWFAEPTPPPSPTPTPSPTPEATPEPTPSSTPTPSTEPEESPGILIPDPTPTPTPEPTPSETPDPTPSPTPETPTPTDDTPDPSPTSSPDPTPDPTPDPSPDGNADENDQP